MTARRKRFPFSPALAGLALLALLAALHFAGSPARGDDELVSLARGGNRVVIADFGLGFCRQCKTQSENLEKIKAAYKGTVIVRFVNINKEKTLTERYGVEMIPHLVFFDARGKIAFRQTGLMSCEEIEHQLSKMGVSP